jgi:DNA polymerase-1
MPRFLFPILMLGILAAAATVEPERFRAPLVESAERLRLNRRLVTLNLTHALPPLEQIPADLPGLTAFLAEMEMRTTLAEARERYGQPELF